MNEKTVNHLVIILFSKIVTVRFSLHWSCPISLFVYQNTSPIFAVKDHLRTLATPRNSFINFVLTYLIVSATILSEIVESTERNMTQIHCPLDPVEKLLLLWVAGYLLQIAERILTEGRVFFMDFWNIYTMMNILFFSISYIIWFVGFVHYNKGLRKNSFCYWHFFRSGRVHSR